MSMSTFFFAKASLGWMATLTGLWWAEQSPWAERVWVLLVVLSATLTISGCVLRQVRHVESAFRFGMDLGRDLTDVSGSGTARVATLPRR